MNPDGRLILSGAIADSAARARADPRQRAAGGGLFEALRPPPGPGGPLPHRVAAAGVVQHAGRPGSGGRNPRPAAVDGRLHLLPLEYPADAVGRRATQAAAAAVEGAVGRAGNHPRQRLDTRSGNNRLRRLRRRRSRPSPNCSTRWAIARSRRPLPASGRPAADRPRAAKSAGHPGRRLVAVSRRHSRCGAEPGSNTYSACSISSGQLHLLVQHRIALYGDNPFQVKVAYGVIKLN